MFVIGNAIVDILAYAGDDFTGPRSGKGRTTPIDENRAGTLYEAMGPAVECSGVRRPIPLPRLPASGLPHFVGKVRDDLFGDIFDTISKPWAFRYPVLARGRAHRALHGFFTRTRKEPCKPTLACVELSRGHRRQTVSEAGNLEATLGSAALGCF